MTRLASEGALPSANAGTSAMRRSAGRPLAFTVALLVMATLSAYLVTVIAVRVDSIFLPGNQITLPAVVQSMPGLNTEPGSAATPPTERINVLVLGLDRRPSEGEEPTRTDTIFILTLDPATRTAGVLSIPRDLWVEIPNGRGGYFYDRINTAYRWGGSSGYRGGPVAAVRDTVQRLIPQVRIDYEAVVDFAAFVKIIDTVGGIEVDVPEAFQFADGISVQGRDGDLPYFPAGRQRMDGQRALFYARYRGGIDGDLGRIRRQQQVMLAVANKLLATSTPAQASDLWGRFSGSMETDLPGFRIPGIALLAKQIGLEGLTLRSLGDVVRDAIDDGGGQVLVTTPGEIATVVNDVFGDPKLRAEAALVEVQNASAGNGMARQTAGFLVQKGLRPDTVSTGLQPIVATEETVIMSYRGKSYTAARVAEWLGVPPSRIRIVAATQAPAAGPDIIVVLGRDVQLPRATPSQTGAMAR